MAKAKAIKEGLEILLKYEPDQWAGAEHDEFFGPPVRREIMTDEDNAKMGELGWHYDDEGGGWAVFT